MFLPIIFPFLGFETFLAGYAIGRMIRRRRQPQFYYAWHYPPGYYYMPSQYPLYMAPWHYRAYRYPYYYWWRYSRY
ncbi:MAG: hypothetical protein QW487_03035 [Candidatus Bathyarchaeia archaeon]|nr:hypothetical protein [Candidatus Bathyarchaeota archaeon]